MFNNTLKSYFFDAFIRWGEEYNHDIFFEFLTFNKDTVIPEKFRKNKRIRIKLTKKTCFNIKIHTNGITFEVYINKVKQDVFIPQDQWISLSSGDQVLDFQNFLYPIEPSVEKEEIKTPDVDQAFSGMHLIWDADKNIKNESVNKG